MRGEGGAADPEDGFEGLLDGEADSLHLDPVNLDRLRCVLTEPSFHGDLVEVEVVAVHREPHADLLWSGLVPTPVDTYVR